MTLLSSDCKIHVVHLVGEQGAFRAAIARFLLVNERFGGNFSLNRCHTNSFEVASHGFFSGRSGKFIMKWRLPGADFRG